MHSVATKVSKVSQAKSGSFWSAFLSVDLYKKNQGRLARQLVAGAIAATVCLLAWSMNQTLLADAAPMVRNVVTAVFLVAGLWGAFRAVNLPQFAEFLIEVQHEMAKVSWPTWPTLRRSTAVVLFVMGMLSVVLFCYDVVWHWLLRLLHVLQF